VQGLIADTRKKINAMDTGALVAEWTAAGASVRELAASPELRQSLASLNSATRKLDAILAEFAEKGPTGESLAKAIADVRGTVVSFNTTALTVQKFINAQQSLGDDASQALVRLGEAAAAVRELADFLERNPSALLTGRKQPVSPSVK
jgi:paraquat-inducible protein B